MGTATNGDGSIFPPSRKIDLSPFFLPYSAGRAAGIGVIIAAVRKNQRKIKALTMV